MTDDVTTPSAPRISDDELARLTTVDRYCVHIMGCGVWSLSGAPTDGATDIRCTCGLRDWVLAAARSAPAAGLDVERLAKEAFDKTMLHVEPWASGPVLAKHGGLFVQNLRDALAAAEVR